MAETVGQHSVAAFTSPVNGTTPIDANSVRGNDNTMRSAYVDHDADPGIHVQSSTLASRPVAGTAGRKWITVSSGRYQLWYDDGSRWHEVASDAVNVDCLADANLAKGDVIKITGFNNGQNLPTVNKVTSSTDVAFGLVENTVTSGNIVQIVNTGLIEDVDTNGYAVGTILYPNTSGGWTTTKPTSGNYQPAGFVLRGNTNNGVLYVEFSAPRIVERSNNEASTIVLRDASGNFAAGTITAGALTSTGLVTFASLKGTGATTVTNILDEDNMASDSATALATQQSIKAYVDTKVATVDTLAEVLANGNTTGANDIIVNAGQKIRTPLIASQNNATAITIADTTGALTLATALADSNLATISTAGKVANSATTATNANTASAIVARDASGNFSAGTITATLNGAAPAGSLTGTTLASNVVTSSLTAVGTIATGVWQGTAISDTYLATISTAGKVANSATTATSANTASAIVARDSSGNFSAGTITANLTGNISGTAPAGTLTGTTLASNVVSSSLTSVGTLSSLTVSGNTSLASSSGGVGIGVAAGSSKLNVAGTFTKNTGDENTWGIRVTDDTAMTTGVGGGLVFVGNYTSGGGKASFASIAGAKANSTTANGLGELRFYTTDVSSVLQQRAVIDSSGRVGIGTASPGYALDVVGGSATALRISGNSAATNNTAMRFYGLNAAADLWAIGNAVSTNDATRNFDIYDLVAGANRFRIDASGNLGVGTTSPARQLSISNATQSNIQLTTTGAGSAITDGFQLQFDGSNNYVWGYENVPTLFGTNNTERARITSGGYFKASSNGTYVSSTGLYHELRSADNAAGLVVTNTSTSYTDDVIYGNVTTAAGTGFKLMRLDANSVEQFRVRGDGTIFAQNTTVQSLSDVRLKENISDAAEGLAVITALRPVRYDWKAGYGNDRKNQLGFVAQEMEAVFPEAVSEWSMDEPTGEVDEDGKPITEQVDYKTVGPGALIPVLVKAIQELEARIAALEA